MNSAMNSSMGRGPKCMDYPDILAIRKSLGARLTFQADFPVAMLILHLLRQISSA